MLRKIIKQGHNTLTVTLPNEWAKRFNLKQGEDISMVERENGLFLSTERINKPSEVTLDISNLECHLVWKHLFTAYRAGYDTIIIKFNPLSKYSSPYQYFAHFISDPSFAKKNNLKPQEFIQEMLERFVGIEILEHGKDYCILKEVGQVTSKEFEGSLRRIFLLLLDMSEGIRNALDTGDYEFLEKVHNVDTQIDKFHDFCERVLNKIGFLEPKKSSIISTLLYVLELVGDEFKHLAVQIQRKNKDKVNAKKIISSLDSINGQLKKFYELYYKYDKEKMIELYKMNKLFVEKIDSAKNGFKEDTQVTTEAISRHIDFLLELLIAMQIQKSVNENGFNHNGNGNHNSFNNHNSNNGLNGYNNHNQENSIPA